MANRAERNQLLRFNEMTERVLLATQTDEHIGRNVGVTRDAPEYLAQRSVLDALVRHAATAIVFEGDDAIDPGVTGLIDIVLYRDRQAMQRS